MKARPPKGRAAKLKTVWQDSYVKKEDDKYVIMVRYLELHHGMQRIVKVEQHSTYNDYNEALTEEFKLRKSFTFKEVPREYSSV